jgi:hypothetical protein
MPGSGSILTPAVAPSRAALISEAHQGVFKCRLRRIRDCPRPGAYATRADEG